MPDPGFVALEALLRQRGARWTPREYPREFLDRIAQQVRVGLVVDQADLAAAMAPHLAAMAPAAAYDPQVDWRDRNGNYVTPPKAQMICGSCTSFGCTSLVESMALIEKHVTLDLSEADLHFCSSHGASCGGWWPRDALQWIKDHGEVDESCFPYIEAFDKPPQFDSSGSLWVPHCHPVANRQSWAVTIGTFGTIANVVDRKNYLTNKGPCVASFDVYDDFRYYSGGIYHHEWGPYLGGHTVEVIGYSEPDGCWICKNSWNYDQWGDKGYFRIAYGECGIDTTYPFWIAAQVTLPSAELGPYGVAGKLTFLRVNEGGYGPPDDFLDCEVVTRLDSAPDMAFGFQLRADGSGLMRKGMLSLLSDAYENNTTVNIEYMLKPYRHNGRIIRLY